MNLLGVISSCGVRACLLEVSAGKPGNVSPGRGFERTSYGDFVRGSRALRFVFKESVLRGFKVGGGDLAIDSIGVGSLIKDGVLAVRSSHRGGNTHLGIIMLLVPLAVGAGFCIGSGVGFERLRFCAGKVMLGTTVKDSLDVFDAICLANPGGLGKSRLDVRDGKSRIKLRERSLTLLDVMSFSSRKDRIAGELASGFPVVFNFVVPNLRKNLKKTKNIKKAIVQTYLQTLAKHPDSLISRKVGLRKSKSVSIKARKIVNQGGVFTKKGRASIKEFDLLLRSEGNKLNPGTKADLIAAGLFIHLLLGK